MNITANTVFIPGSTSGIGLALALRLEAKGNTVIAEARGDCDKVVAAGVH